MAFLLGSHSLHWTLSLCQLCVCHFMRGIKWWWWWNCCICSANCQDSLIVIFSMKTWGSALDRVHNWRRPLPLDRDIFTIVSLRDQTAVRDRLITRRHNRNGAARLSRRDDIHFVTLWPWSLTFDLIFVGGRGTTMHYSCAKFGDFSFSRFGFFRADRHADRITSDRENYRCGWSLYWRDYRRRQ